MWYIREVFFCSETLEQLSGVLRLNSFSIVLHYDRNMCAALDKSYNEFYSCIECYI